MNSSLKYSVFILLAVGFFSANAMSAMRHQAPSLGDKQKVIESELGLNIPKLGIAIDAIYDKQLDDLLPGYKILNVVLTNRSVANIELDPKKDKWQIIDSLGRTHRAITHLAIVDKKLWGVLPVGLKNELEYPHIVRIGHTTKIDLIFPADVEIDFFRQMTFVSSTLKKTFVLKNSAEKNLDWEPKEEKIPVDTKAKIQSEQKYKTETLDGGTNTDTQPIEEVPQEPAEEQHDPMTSGTTIPLD